MSGGVWRNHASWMRNSSGKRSSALMLSQLSASSFSTRVESERRMSVHAPPTLCPNDSMIDISSSSFDPMTRYTVPVPSPAAEAMSRIVVIS
jgi:hypothetical protein